MRGMFDNVCLAAGNVSGRELQAKFRYYVDKSREMMLDLVCLACKALIFGQPGTKASRHQGIKASRQQDNQQ